MDNEIHNRKYLKEIRQELRNNLIPSEARLWGCPQNKQLKGRKFRKQHSIENYVVDFYCPSEKLIVEVDGNSHDDIGSQNSDFERDEKLKKIEFTIVRIPAIDVLHNIEGVLEEIASYFKDVDNLK